MVSIKGSIKLIGFLHFPDEFIVSFCGCKSSSKHLDVHFGPIYSQIDPLRRAYLATENSLVCVSVNSSPSALLIVENGAPHVAKS